MYNHFKEQDKINSLCIFGKKKDKIDLSIVIPTYKRNFYLEKVIESILRQKKPQYIKYQVIIVSNDPDYTIDDLNIKLDENIFLVYKNTENLGMVGNINRCAKLANGKFVSYIQDDDLLLEDYLITIESLILSNEMNNIDCLIPNRYYYYNLEEKSNFGKKAYVNEKFKNILKKFLSIGIKKKMFQKITFNDCANTWYNCFSGGPTCGIIFNREKLLKSNGFSHNYPFSFDYVFFIEFSSKNNVLLYNKYLSIYRMNNSASNRPEVQLDFYKGDLYLLDKVKKQNKFVKFFEKEIIRFSIKNKSIETQEMIKDHYSDSCFISYNKIKYIIFRIARIIFLFRYDLYRKENVPSKYLNLM